MTEAPLHARLRFRFIFSFRNGIQLFTNNVPLHDLAVLVDTECYRPRFFRCSSKPSARFLTAGLFCGLQGGFSIGMRNLPASVFGLLHGPARQEGGLLIPTRPDVVRNLRYRRGNKKGLMWIHGPKGNASLCQSAAASTVHGHRALESLNYFAPFMMLARILKPYVQRFAFFPIPYVNSLKLG